MACGKASAVLVLALIAEAEAVYQMGIVIVSRASVGPVVTGAVADQSTWVVRL